MSLVPVVTNSVPNQSIYAPVGAGGGGGNNPYQNPSSITTSSITVNVAEGFAGRIEFNNSTSPGINIVGNLPINLLAPTYMSTLRVSSINGEPADGRPETVSNFSTLNVSTLTADTGSIGSLSTSQLTAEFGSISTLNVSTLNYVVAPISTVDATDVGVSNILNSAGYSLVSSLFCNMTLDTVNRHSQTDPGAFTRQTGLTYLVEQDGAGNFPPSISYSVTDYFSKLTDPYFAYQGQSTFQTSTILGLKYFGNNFAYNNGQDGFAPIAMGKVYFVSPTVSNPVGSPFIVNTGSVLHIDGGPALSGSVAISTLFVSSINGNAALSLAGPSFEEAVRSIVANMVFSTINVSSINGGPP